MADSDDPFLPPDLDRARPRPGAGRRACRTRACTSARRCPGSPRSNRSRSRRARSSASDSIRWSRRRVRCCSAWARCGAHRASIDVPSLRRRGARRDSPVRGARARRRRAQRNRACRALRALCAASTKRCCRRRAGAQSEWAQHPLLVALHREAWGGEKFFEMLDRISSDPARHIDLMELQYLILALGFTGKYQMLERGHEQLADLQHNLHRTIQNQRGAAPADCRCSGAASRIDATG